MIQLPHPYVTTGRKLASTIRAFVGKVRFLLFNTLSGFAIASLTFHDPFMDHRSVVVKGLT